MVTGAPKVSIVHPNGIGAALHQAQTCRMEAERTAAQLEASKAFYAAQLELLRADLTACQSQCASQLRAMHAQVAAMEARHAEQLCELRAAMQAAEAGHLEALKSKSKGMEMCATLLRPSAHCGLSAAQNRCMLWP